MLKINSKVKEYCKDQIIIIKDNLEITNLMEMDSRELTNFNMKDNLKMVKNQVEAY